MPAVIDPETPFDIVTASRRNAKHWRAGTATWRQLRAWMDDPADHKESGGYVLGTLTPSPCDCPKHKGEAALLRRATTINTRSALTLDVDYPGDGFEEALELVLPGAALAHTTYSSRPEKPRWRLILPLSRSVAPDEYYAIAETVMSQLGHDQFDPGSSQPERYMFKPAAQRPEWFRFIELDGPPLDADALLADFEPDLSKLPPGKPSHRKRNPFEVEGVVGSFNRAYEDFSDLFEVYQLPYTECGSDRWQLVGARSVGGLSLVADGLVYSHHAHDPAYGQACSAFDLVRLHRFGDLDEDVKPGTPVNKRPSHAAMLELAARDARVLNQQFKEDFGDTILEDYDPSWASKLVRNNQGRIRPTVGNHELVAEHDLAWRALRYNVMSLTVEIHGPVPWERSRYADRTFSSADRADLEIHLDRTYEGLDMPIDAFLARLGNTAVVNPLHDYLEGLTWDGVPRIETALPGVTPTEYTRRVARKCLVAAVARVFEPGIKWDHTLVLFGPQGKGKTTWIERLARGYAAPLGKPGDKDTLLTMQRSWILIADEGHALRSPAAADQLKEFLTRTVDVYRAPYDRQAQVHPRHSVIWSTTNDKVFLARQAGNRRFLIVQCTEPFDPSSLTDEYIDQLWAEAVHIYRAGTERLYLTAAELAEMEVEQEPHVEEDSLSGQIEAYLEMLVPEEWDEWAPAKRRDWMSSREDGFAEPGTEPINEVSAIQVYREAFGGRPTDHNARAMTRQIYDALSAMPGWELAPTRPRDPHYGRQRVFRRLCSTELDADDLL